MVRTRPAVEIPQIVGLTYTAMELAWLQSLFGELGLFLKNTPIIWYDNVGATYLAVNGVTTLVRRA